MNFKLKSIVYTAVFATLCCVSTLVITIPLPYGYLNLGDVFVLLSGWFLGPLFGAAASAIGSMTADLISGYVQYAPVTFIVKGVVSIAGYFVWVMLKKVIKAEKNDFIARLISGLIAEVFMILGYFIYESILYGIAGGALALLGNTIQGVGCTVVAVLLMIAVCKINYFRKLFPLITRGSDSE